MNDEILKWLFDAHRAAQAVRRFVGDAAIDAYLGDELLRSAVERKLGIVGEALVRIRRVDSAVLEEIREYRNIISFRNILIHNYDGLDPRIVWGVIEDDLPLLVEDLERLLPSESP